jgi:hypothetical protein
MILNEGGNVFANSEPFDHKDVPAILQTVNGALQGTGITAIPVGSAATPHPGQKSGDMDVIVDEQSVLDFFKAKDAKSGRKALNDYIASKGLETAQTGINVHVNVPVGDQHHQVDIMVTGNATKVAKFHTHDIPQGSPYKGVNKQLMLAILAKSKGYMWSAWQGLFDRNPEGKKGNFVADDLDSVAQILLGNNATAANLGSVEAILKSLPDDQAAALLDRAKQDPNWVEKKPAESMNTESINRMKKLAGMKEADVVSPRFAGVQQTKHTDGGQTTDYQAGSLQTTNKVDAQGRPITSKATYDLGVGKIGAEQDHTSGIRTSPADPKKFAAFQKQKPKAVKESPELTAMLTIARLR